MIKGNAMQQNLMLDTFGIARRAAAEIAGLTQAQIANWIAKPEYGLFPELRAGTGRDLDLRLGHVVTLAAIRELIDLGLKERSAVNALKNSPMWPPSPTSGKVEMTKGETYPVMVGSDRAKAKVVLDEWLIFEAVYPAFVDAVRGNRGKLTRDEVEKMIEAYERLLADWRKLREAADER